MAVGLLAGLAGTLSYVGADARWLAALGGDIAHRGSVPSSIPFMAAAAAHWPNPLVLAELIFHGLETAIGDRGLALAQLLAVGAALAILARDAQSRGGDATGMGGALALAVIGSFPSLAIARVQMFSLVLFPILVALLRAEERRPSWRIWLAVPLIALWSNLHGAVLLGLVTLFAYLLLARGRAQPLIALGVAVAGALALCATPAGFGTVGYLHGLATNLAAQRGEGQWAPLGQNPFDFVAVAAALVLALKLRGSRPRLWELAVMAGLIVLTVKAARDDVWLLFFLVGPAGGRSLLKRDLSRLLPVGGVLAAALMILAVVRAPSPVGASPPMVQRALALAGGGPVLADGIAAEQVALAGGRIWAGNPIDALPIAAQAAYLDWLKGSASGMRELRSPEVRVVLVGRGSATETLVRRDARFTLTAQSRMADLYVRR